MAKPSITKVEIAEMALRDLLRAELSDADRASLTAAMATVQSLAPNVSAADHLPVFTTAANGDQRVVGCSCSFVPKARPQRGSMMMSPFNTHLAKIGVPRNYDADGNQQPRYIDGPKAGMTMNEAHAAGLGY